MESLDQAQPLPSHGVHIWQVSHIGGHRFAPTLEEKSPGGQLGRPSGAKFRTYERLKHHAQAVKGTLFESQDLVNAIDQVYRYPLRQAATDQLNRQLKSGVDDQQLADLVVALYQDERLCLVYDSEADREPQIIGSMGLFQPKG